MIHILGIVGQSKKLRKLQGKCVITKVKPNEIEEREKSS